MTSKELQTMARTLNADVLANNIGVEATVLRRWINGGINANIEKALRDLLLLR